MTTATTPEPDGPWDKLAAVVLSGLCAVLILRIVAPNLSLYECFIAVGFIRFATYQPR